MPKIFVLPDTFRKSTGENNTTTMLYNRKGTNDFSVRGQVRSPTIDYSSLTPAKGFIETANVGYISNFEKQDRPQPIQDKLFNILQTAAQQSSVNVVIFSGGQAKWPNGPRVGSTRHDLGYAADIWLYTKITDYDNATEAALRRADVGGTQAENIKLEGPLSVSNPRTAKICLYFCKACYEAGATAIGAGSAYMGGVGIHVDIAYKNTTNNVATHWGNGGSSRGTIGWLRTLAANYPINRNT